METFKVIIYFCLLSYAIAEVDFYRAVTIEYYSEKTGTIAGDIKQNLKNYLNILKDIHKGNQTFDLIIFPEASLAVITPLHSHEEILANAVEVSKTNDTPNCDQPNLNHVDTLRCASIQYNTYICVNVQEKSDNDELFNTNVVFDRQGRIVARYRKIHVYDEPWNSNGTQPEIFETDFGVKFGIFICFDIMFENPIGEMYKKGVRHYIMSTFWYSELPHLVSAQVHNGWTLRHNNVLLASGANNGSGITSGTGIYLGRRGIVGSIISNKHARKVIIANVPKDYIHAELPNVKVEYIHEDLERIPFLKDNTPFNQYAIEQNGKNGINKSFCHGRFCCHLKLVVNDTSDLYFLIYSGRKNAAGTFLGIQSCILVQCSNEDCSTWPTKDKFAKDFSTLEVTVIDPKDGVDYFPRTDLDDLHFLPVTSFNYDHKKTSLALTKASVGIYNFGFYGRNYKEDL